MTDTFKGIITADGKKRQLPYNAVFGTPVSDPTLSLEGTFADSKAVGDKFKEVKAETSSLKGDLGNFSSEIEEIVYIEKPLYKNRNYSGSGMLYADRTGLLLPCSENIDATNFKGKTLKVHVDSAYSSIGTADFRIVQRDGNGNGVDTGLCTEFPIDTTITIAENASYINLYIGVAYSISSNTETNITYDNLIIGGVTFKEKSGVIIVAKSGGDYTTISEAVANANDSVDNPITIMIYPGTYDEHITLLDRYVSIIGVNRDTCIIRDDSGKYNNDPIKISGGKWRLENISLVSTHSKAGSWVPSWNFPDLPSYALHIDNGSANGFGVVNNCFLYCENLNTIGAGTHNGETIRIENCQIVRNTTDPNYISDDYKGAVACHSPNIYDNTETESHFNMYNCEIICNLDKALQLRHQSSKAKMKSIMVGNTLIANGSVTDVVNFAGSHTSKTDYIEIQSHGNSTTELNY